MLRGIFYVTIQMLCLALIVLTGPVVPAHPVLALLAISGMLLGVWAIVAMQPANVSVLPDVRPTTRLVLRGPYRYIRHPMYAALLLFTAALLLNAFSLWRLLLWCTLLIVLIRKLSYEEQQLLARFPDYDSYRQRSARLLPFVY